jgi:hypothetical protein
VYILYLFCRCEFVESSCVKFCDTVKQCCPDDCCKGHREGKHFSIDTMSSAKNLFLSYYETIVNE